MQEFVLNLKAKKQHNFCFPNLKLLSGIFNFFMTDPLYKIVVDDFCVRLLGYVGASRVVYIFHKGNISF